MRQNRYSLPGEHREPVPVGSSRASSNNAMQRASSLRAVSCKTTTSRESSCSITQRHRLGAPALWGTILAWYGDWTIRIIFSPGDSLRSTLRKMLYLPIFNYTPSKAGQMLKTC
jgi:hypothetical protein